MVTSAGVLPVKGRK